MEREEAWGREIKCGGRGREGVVKRGGKVWWKGEGRCG